MSGGIVEASAPARVDLAGGTLDLWPLHVLHPGSITVNVAISLRAGCRVRLRSREFRVLAPDRGLDRTAPRVADLLDNPDTALVGSILDALRIATPVEVELSSEVPFGSGLGGSSALTVSLLGALERFSARRPAEGGGIEARVAFVRDVETRVLGKPAGVQDYYPPLEGGAHVLRFETGRTSSERLEVDPVAWERHATLFDTGASHSSGMNNWEILRARLEGDREVAAHLDGVRRAAETMARAVEDRNFDEMGRALGREWDARRQLAPVVSTPTIEAAIAAARSAGAWGGKACGAGGGGCVVFLSPPERTPAVRAALRGLGPGNVLTIRVENSGVRVSES